MAEAVQLGERMDARAQAPGSRRLESTKRSPGGELAGASGALPGADEEGAGFAADTNRVTLVSRAGAEELPLQLKTEVAEAILDRVEALLGGR